MDTTASRDSGPVKLADILAAAQVHIAAAEPADTEIAGTPEAPVPPRQVDSDWFLHESRVLRAPVYRTERADLDRDPVGSYFEQPAAHQLPLLTYEYDAQTTVISRIGELGTRDMLVMSVLSQAFWASGCPDDNKVRGDQATLGSIARQLDMNPQGSARLMRASIERLSTARVKFKATGTELSQVGPVNTRTEVTVGFVANFGFREMKQKGKAMVRDNYIQLDQAMADLIRAGEFTFLKAEVLRALRSHPLALKLYAWARTHRPDDRGRIFYGVGRLASQLGCSDQNSTRRRRKMAEAAQAVCKVAPDEFLGFELRQGRADQVLVLRKKLRSGAPLLAAG